MQKPAQMREVGRLKAPPLVRFGRVQRRVARLAPHAGQPPGVFRFRTWEELALWRKKSLRPD